jgi:hypothetical protein
MSPTRLNSEHRRALPLLAENPDGYTRAVMLAPGISLPLTAGLINTGLATNEAPDRRAPATRRLRPGHEKVQRQIVHAGTRKCLPEQENSGGRLLAKWVRV